MHLCYKYVTIIITTISHINTFIPNTYFIIISVITIAIVLRLH